MRYVSLFSGIEAATVAWEPLGFEPVGFSEIDSFCNEVLSSRYPHIPNLGDISRIDWGPYHGNIDIIVGGSPCQSFSVAGKRAGLLDDRGALMLEYVRAIREIKPTWCLWENVPGVLSQDGGRAFAALQGELEDCGYSLVWRVLDAQYFGIPQRRRRVFLVGHARPECAAAVLFERESLCGNLEAGRSTGQNPAAQAEERPREAGSARIAEEGFLDLYDHHRADARVKGPLEICPTVTAHYGTGGVNTPIIHSKSSTPEVFSIVGNIIGRQLHTGGNGNGFQLGSKPMYTLTATDVHAIAQTGGNEISPGHRSVTSSEESIVRRLMPIECERLQGFPDDWTLIKWNGRPEEECPDSRRYRAIGNSMAVPVMRWIGEGFLMVESLIQEEPFTNPACSSMPKTQRTA